MKRLTQFVPRFLILSILVSPPLASASAGRIVAGADASSGGPHVKVFTSRTQTNVASFFAYAPTFTGGVRVAAGDVNGDGAADIITGSGPGAAHVKVFSGRNQAELHNFLPYGSGFAGGIFVASGDVNGDGFDDIVTGTDAGAAPQVKVFSGTTGGELHSFFAYPAGFMGGVRVAVGDINNDGYADIITGSGPGGGPHVKVFNGVGAAEIRSFFAYSVSFTGGVFVASGDITGVGRADIITGTDSGSAPHVKVFNGSSLAELHSFFAYTPSFLGGVRVTAGDMNGDGRDEILTAPGSGTTPLVKVLDGLSLGETASFLAYPASFTGGVFVGAASVKHPRLGIASSRSPHEIQLQWPAGCQCELEGNPDAVDPRGWKKLDVQPVESGHRLGLLLPAVQKVQFFRLKCDAEVVRP
jgi:hypothetical protein